MHSYYDLGYATALDHYNIKTAARRGFKMIRDLVRTGNPADLERANQLAKTPGYLKESPTGSAIRFLGRKPSTEGPAVLTAHPEFGVSTASIPDPKGLTTRTLTSTRKELSDRLDHPSVTKILGVREYEGLQHPIIHREYVPGRRIADLSQRERVSAYEQLRSYERAAKAKGFDLYDVHGGNMIMRPDGVAKVIDPAPMRTFDPRGNPFRPIQGDPLRIEPVASWQRSMKALQDHGSTPVHLGPPPPPEVPVKTPDFAATLAKARAAPPPPPKVDPHQAMIEAFLAKKRGG
jgi:hypothetical protein